MFSKLNRVVLIIPRNCVYCFWWFPLSMRVDVFCIHRNSWVFLCLKLLPWAKRYVPCTPILSLGEHQVTFGRCGSFHLYIRHSWWYSYQDRVVSFLIILTYYTYIFLITILICVVNSLSLFLRSAHLTLSKHRAYNGVIVKHLPSCCSGNRCTAGPFRGSWVAHTLLWVRKVILKHFLA